MASLDRITRRDDINDPDFVADNQLVFRATFTGDVQNVTADDFNVTGTSGATVTDVRVVNNRPSQYDITIAEPSLSTFTGEVGIELADTQDIVDAGDNSPVPTAAPLGRNDTYTLTGSTPVDTTPPSITSITRQNPGDTITDADALTFRVTFSEDVQNVNAFDFAVDGTTTATVSGFSEISSSLYDIRVAGGDLADFNGSVGLDLADAQNITDLAGNALPAGEPATDEVYTVINAAVPLLNSIERLAPATELTNSDTLVFRVTFSETVQAVDVTDFVVEGGTTAGVTNVTATDTNNNVYDVTVSGGDLATFNGSVSLALASGQDITNLSNEAVPIAPPALSNETYTVSNDALPPVFSSIERLTPGTANTSDDILVFQATFNEGVQNVDATDFSINGNTTATITDVTAVSNSVYNITVSGGDLATFNGSVGIDLADKQNITDLIGNPLSTGEPATDESYSISNTTPPTSTPDSSLTVIGNLLEITQLGSALSLNFTISTSSNVTVETIKVFSTDAGGNNRTQIGSFSIIEGTVLPIEYTPGFSLEEVDIATGTFLQFEVEEINLDTNTTVVRTATLTSVSSTEVSLDFGNGTQIATTLANEVAVTNFLLNDAAAIDLTGLTGQSSVKFTVYREAGFNNTVGFYTTDFADGRIIIDQVTGATISPGETGYKAAALANQLNVQLTGENNQVKTFDTVINNGVFLGTYVVVDGTDPAADEVFFSHQGVGSFDQIRQVGINAFGIEDIVGGGDQDFNDLVVEFEISATTI